MKKVLASAFSLLLGATVLAGCQNSNSNQQTSAGGTQTIELTIAHNMDFVTIPNSIIEAGNRLNQKYAAEGKNIKVVFNKQYYTIDWTQYHNKIVFADKSGTAPDIMTLDGDIPGLVKAGTLLNVNDLMLPQFKQQLFEPFKYNGNYYGVPVDMPLRVIYYSKNVLKALGWSDQQMADLPKKIADGQFTLQNFMDVAKSAVDKGICTAGLAHRPGSGPDFLDMMNDLGGEYYTNDGKLVFDEAGLQRTFDFFYQNAVVNKITPNNSSELGWNAIDENVGTGKYFAYYGPLFSATYAAKPANKTPEQFAADESFALFPVSQYTNKPFAVAAPEGVGISAHTKYPQVCKDLIKELATTSNDLFAQHASTIFSLSSVTAADTNSQITQNPILKDLTYMSGFSKVVPNVNGLNFYTDQFYKEIQQVELGKITAADAVKDFKSQVQANLPSSDVIFK